MIPLKDENPSNTIPIVNVSLILANIFVFIYQYFVAPGGPSALFYQLGCIPYWILIQVLSGFVEYGAQSGSGIAWFAHIGGFATGFLLIIMIKRRGKKI